MGKSKKITEHEKGQIDRCCQLNDSISKIARVIKRSRKLVYNYTRNRELYASRKSSGRPGALGPKTIKDVIQMASNKSISSGCIRSKLDLPVVSRTVRNYLTRDGCLEYAKMKGRLPLKPEHKKSRVDLALKTV